MCEILKKSGFNHSSLRLLLLPVQVANAKVLDVLRQMSTFELSMMRLDIRQVRVEGDGNCTHGRVLI